MSNALVGMGIARCVSFKKLVKSKHRPCQTQKCNLDWKNSSRFASEGNTLIWSTTTMATRSSSKLHLWFRREHKLHEKKISDGPKISAMEIYTHCISNVSQKGCSLAEVTNTGLFCGTEDRRDFFSYWNDQRINAGFSFLCIVFNWGRGKWGGGGGENLRIWLSLRFKKVFSLILSAVNCAG